MVLAMGYSVTVSAAERLMKTLYRQLFADADLRCHPPARAELYNRKEAAGLLQPDDRPGGLAAAGRLPEPATTPERTGFYDARARRFLRTTGSADTQRTSRTSLRLCGSRPGYFADREVPADQAQHPAASRHGRSRQDHAAAAPGCLVEHDRVRRAGLLLRL